jgi:hypothetical protein
MHGKELGWLIRFNCLLFHNIHSNSNWRATPLPFQILINLSKQTWLNFVLLSSSLSANIIYSDLPLWMLCIAVWTNNAYFNLEHIHTKPFGKYFVFHLSLFYWHFSPHLLSFLASGTFFVFVFGIVLLLLLTYGDSFVLSLGFLYFSISRESNKSFTLQSFHYLRIKYYEIDLYPILFVIQQLRVLFHFCNRSAQQQFPETKLITFWPILWGL